MKKQLTFLCTLLFLIMNNLTAQHYQFPNPSFNTWKSTSSGSAIPRGWHSFSDAEGGWAWAVSNHSNTASDRFNVSQHACQIYTTSVLGVKANGAMTLGKMVVASTSTSSDANLIYTKRSDADSSGCKWSMAGRPDSVRLWVKFEMASASSIATCKMHIHGNYDYQDIPSHSASTAQTGKIANAFCEMVKNQGVVSYGSSSNFWERFDFKFTYYDDNNNVIPNPTLTNIVQASQSFILASFSTNKTVGGGSENDKLYFDDMELVYNKKLASLSIGGTAIPASDLLALNNTAFASAVGNPHTAYNIFNTQGLAVYEYNQPVCAGIFPEVSATAESGLINGITYTPATASDPYTTIVVTHNDGSYYTYKVHFANIQSSPTVNLNSESGEYFVCQNGSLTMTASGNAASYQWSNGLGNSNNANPPTGTVGTTTYTVTGYSSNGCGTTVTATVTVNPLPAVTLSNNSSQEVCSGAAISTINVNFSGGDPSSSGLPGLSFNANNGVITGTPNATSTYTIIVTSPYGCGTANASGTITVNPQPVATLSPNSVTACEGTAITVTATTSGGTVTPTLPAGLNYNPETGEITGIPEVAGTITIASVSANCGTATADCPVTITPAPSVSLSNNKNQNLCNSDQFTSITVNYANGSVNVSGLTGTGLSYANGQITGSPMTGSHTYYVTVTSLSGCGSVSDTGTVTVSTIPTVTLSPSNFSVCLNANIEGLTISPYNNSTVVNGLPNGVSFDNTTGQFIGAPSEVGTFNISVTTSTNCGNAQTEGTFTVKPLPSISLSNSNIEVCEGEDINTINVTTTNCSNSTATILSNGLYFSGLNNNIGTITGTPTTAGNFTVTAISNNQCGNATADGSVTIKTKPTVSINGPESLCQNVTSTFTAEGNFASCEWDDNSTNATRDITPTQPGQVTYSVTVMGSNSCTNNASTTVIVQGSPEMPNATTVSNSSCHAPYTGSINVISPLGNYTYSINGTDFQQSTQFNNLSAGTYTLTVKNASGCTSSDTFAVGSTGSTVTANAQANNPCVGGDLTLFGSASTDDVSYTWNGPNGYTSTEQNPIIGNASTDLDGEYSLVVTENATGCTSTAPTIIVSVRPQPTVSIAQAAINPSVCPGASLNILVDGQNGTLSASGLPDGVTLTNGFINGTVSTPGTYNYTVTNTSDCGTAYVEGTITVYERPVITFTGTPSFCQNFSTTIGVEQSYNSYVWSNNNSGKDIPVNAAGLYSVTVTDGNSCQNSASLTVTMNIPPMEPIVSVTDNANCTPFNGAITIEAPTGDNYLYSIDGEEFQASPVFDGLESDEYTITVEDNNGCQSMLDGIFVDDFAEPVYEDISFETFNSYEWNGTVYPESGDFTAIFPGAATNGCDSIVTLHLTILEATTTIVEQTACESFTWINGETYYESTNEPTVTLQTVNNTDSIIVLHLTINQPATSIDEQTACGEFTWINGETYYESTNEPTFILPEGAANGCDSIITLHLTVNQSSTSIDEQTACGEFTWIDGETYYESTDEPTFTLLNGAANGCDSIITLHLTVKQPATGIDEQTACESFTWIDGETYYESTDEPTFTLQNGAANGCDSIITLHLTISQPTTGIDEQTACEEFTWINGVTYYESTNEPTFVLAEGAANGCDSTVTLHLTVNHGTHNVETVTANNSYTWHGQNLTVSDTYTFDYENPENGCPSTDTLHLTVLESTTTVDEHTACESFTWIDGVTYYASTNTPSVLLQAANGADSIVVLHLTILQPATSIDEQTACGEFTWIDGETYYESTDEPTFTLQNGAANGCDSIITLHLTVNQPATGIDEQTACGEFTWIDGETYYASTDEPTFTLQNGAANGCDSTVTLHLTVNQPATGIDEQTVCEEFTWINGVTYYESTNEPTFVLAEGAANGCDSTVTLHLTVNHGTHNSETVTANNSYTWHGQNLTVSDTYTFDYENPENGCPSTDTLHLTVLGSTTTVDEHTACESFTWIDGVTYYTSTNTPSVLLQAANGADSIVVLHLTILQPATSIDKQTACGEFTWIDGETYYESTDEPTFTLQNGAANGCDSIITLHLTVNQPATGIDEQTACGEFTWIDGETYYESTDEPTFTLQNGAANGCDSTVTLHLTVNQPATGIDEQTVCEEFTWINGVTYYESTDEPTFTLAEGAANGCDSTVTLHLTVNHGTHNVETVTANNSYTWHGQNLTVSDTYTFDYENPENGCPSTDTLHLTVLGSTTTVDEHTACGSFTWIDGVTYYASTNTPSVLLQAANGADSIVVLHLTILQPATSIDEQTACGEFIWIDGETYYESTDEPTFTLQNGAANGCDSIITLHLTVNQPATGIDEQTACGEFTWIDGETYYESTDEPTFTLQNGAANGCDSTVTLHLTVNQPATGIDEQTVCEEFTWINGVTYYESTDEPTFTLAEGAANGCDSTVTLHLTVNHGTHNVETVTANNSYTWHEQNLTVSDTYTFDYENPENGCPSTDTLHLTVLGSTTTVDEHTACESFTWIDGVTYYASTNTPSVLLQAANGADSIVVLHLTILQPATSIDEQTACGEFTWIDGETYYESTDEPMFTLQNGAANGCDSIITLHLTVNQPAMGIDEQTVCEEFTWINGVTYYESTNEPTFVLAEGAANGCDSTVTLHLTVNYGTHNAETVTANDSYTWHGQNLTVSDIYTFDYENPENGCPSTDTLHLTVLGSTTTVDEQTACGEFTWIDDVTYYASTNTPSVLLQATNGADSIVVLHLTILQPATSIDEQTACGEFTWIDGETYYESTDEPTFTLQNGAANGCDSIITLHLTVNQPATGIDEKTVCEEFTWIDGVTYYESTNEPTFVLAEGAANGCDSTVTLHLTVNNGTHNSETVTANDSYTWHGEELTVSDTYTFDYENPENGCPSTDTLHLTILESTTTVDEHTACESFTWIDGVTYYESTNTPSVLLQAVNGADSIVVLHLTINQPATSIDEQTACEEFTWINGVTYYESTEEPTFTLENGAANGCDSIVTLHLTINQPTTGIDEQTACEEFTWINGVTYYESTEEPTFTLTNGAANGCDSTVTLHLTVNNGTHNSETVTANDSYTWHGEELTVSDTYTFDYENPENGCPSTDTLHLTILESITTIDEHTACVSFTWIDGVTYYESTNTPSVQLQATNGADSIIILHLTILQPTTGIDEQTSCESFTWIDGMTYYESTNEPTFTLTNGAANGCDSTVTLHLTINQPTTGIDEQTACEEFTWINGVTYYESTDEPTFTLQNGAANGCDSTVTLHLTINQPTMGDTIATACESFDWYDLNITESGNYTHTISGGNVNGCDSTVTLHLTINYNVTGDTTAVECNSFNWYDYTNITESCDNLTHTFQMANGCDSTVTLHLTILKPNAGTLSVDGDNTICQGESTELTATVVGNNGYVTYAWNIEANNNEETVTVNPMETTEYTVTATATLAHNNVICTATTEKTIFVTVNHPTSGTDTRTACDSLKWIDNVTYYTNINGPSITLNNANVNGCDSTVTLNLTIRHSSHNVSYITECDVFEWHGTPYTTSDIYTFNYTNDQGCPSTDTLHLTIKHGATSDTTAVECETFDWYEHINITESGEYTHSFPMANGCDSVVTLYITINKPITIDTTIQVCNFPHTFMVPNTHIERVYVEPTTDEFTVTKIDGSCDSIYYHINVVELTSLTYDGHEYPILKLGSDCWFAENLRVNTGDASPYQDNIDNVEKFGLLYTWYDAVGEDHPQGTRSTTSRATSGVCPEGWTLPTIADFENLIAAVEGDINKLKSADPTTWFSGSAGSTDGIGFNAPAGGYYNPEKHQFERILLSSKYWTATAGNTDSDNMSIEFNYYCVNALFSNTSKDTKLSIRCISVR